MDNIINQNNSKQKGYNFTDKDKREIIEILMASSKAIAFSSQEYLFLKAKMQELLKKFEILDIGNQQRMVHAIYWDIKLMMGGYWGEES